MEEIDWEVSWTDPAGERHVYGTYTATLEQIVEESQRMIASPEHPAESVEFSAPRSRFACTVTWK